MLHLIPVIPFVYILLRLIWPLAVKLKFKLLAGTGLLLISQYHFFLKLGLGSMASPELPMPLLLFCSWVYIAFILLFFFALIKDLLSLLLFLLRGLGLPLKLPFSPAQQAAGLLILALGLSAFGLWQAVRPPALQSTEVTLPRLPKELDGFKILHITDIHASALLNGERVRQLVNTAMSAQADIILISGDLTDGSVANRANDVAALKELAAPYGVWACLGNHEHYSDFPGWMEAYAKLGITMLHNRHTTIALNGKELVIAGVTDPVAEKFNLPTPNILLALENAPTDAVRILMAHQPRNAPENARAGVDLQLSGHTHGGQMLGFDQIVKKVNGGFVRGWYELPGMKLFVSPGAGLWPGFPARLGIASELTLITLRSPKN